MPERAHLTSVEALESFRAALILYLSKARPALEEVNAALGRTRIWIEEDRRRHWEHQRRQRLLQLERARNALSSARMSNVHGAGHEEQVGFRRAKAAYDEAETKLKILKRWSREFDGRVGPQAKQLDRLMDHFITHLPRAVAFLTQLIRTLDQYTAAPAVPVSPALGPTLGSATPLEPDTEGKGGAPGAPEPREPSPASGGSA